MYNESFRNCLRLAILCLWGSAALAAEAPSGPVTGAASQNFIRNDQQRLLEEQQRKLQQLQRLPGKQVERPAAPEQAETRCFPVTEVTLDGVTLLDEATRQALIEPFDGRCLSADDLNELLGAITQAYVDRGFVTTRAYLPQQDLSRRRLRVVVVEGRIEAIESQAASPTARELAMASPAEAGDALNLRDLEQLIDQLNRLPSNRATLELVPGDTVGSSRVQVINDRQDPLRFTLGRNNAGSDGTGEQQWSAGLEWDSPLGLADQFVAQLGHDVSDHPAYGSANSYLSYSLPYGYWTFSYSYTDSDYRSLAEANGFTFTLEGRSERHRLSVERLLLRDNVSKTSANIALSRLSTRNYIDGARIEVSSQRLSGLDIGLNHGRRIGNAFINLDLGWQRGLTLFGAQHDANDAPGTPTAQYEKTTLTLSYLQPFSLVGERFTFSSLAHGQWSDDVLYSPQRLSIGGRHSVRGFKKQAMSGDSGAYWRNQVTWHYPFDVARPLFNRLETTLAYDVGVIHGGEHNPEIHGRLSGYAIGFGLSGKHLAANVSFAHSLERPAILDERETPVYFSVNVRF